MKICAILCLAVIAALIPHEALAWGPGVHLALGNSVLANLYSLPPLVAELLAQHRNAYLYGCLSADIFIGKGTNFKPGHSHNWVTGFKLLKSAGDPRVMSYAYGYLTHLAADVVAHNYYVPNSLWTMPSGGKISHVYVEAQADRPFKEERESALALFRRPNRDTDGTLLSAMDRKRLPFLLKKQIVKGSLHLTGSREWGYSLRLADRILPWPLPDSQLNAMFTLSQNLVFDFLSDPMASIAVSFDPIGSRNLRLVREMRTTRRRRQGQDGLLFPPHPGLEALPVAFSSRTDQAAATVNG
ncbi:zinc dependent phospholipase C family protein [Pseudodesulfovibrio piezophilus]|uniref:Phospholipase C/D domain-containing protein n=1 Tax=Pseudodesulfovibrio piezophilus (strain DSM 21447 / JCM 15486 / C1TLV30) TaxID=1322246 RepID=M1WW93_PSEP2|nr:zinc dependent phospholipase C family protein [Pseudodesulfovibrio piezophilus]CCH49008.1 conserved exported protein of unknown function [Pseudodesulfovibrio piezophilus C1TLV30]